MMNVYSTPEALREAVRLSGCARFDGGLKVTNPQRFRTDLIDALVWTAVFGPGAAKDAARHAIREAAESLGILPASILPLYRARGKGEVSGFTVPAINIRMMAYDSARAALRAARKHDVGAVIFEIARSEMGYTEQRPAEYAAVMLAAAIREEWQGPFFIQGDHFQTNPKKMKEAADKEIKAIEALIDEAIPAGFLQIDIDTSTLVDLSKATLEAQQDVNANLCAEFTKYIRARQPKAMPISVGGEIGEVGKENSTPEEFRAYMDVYRKALGGASVNGIEKVSVQTGSSHGGVVGADGTVQRLAIDFTDTVYDHPVFPQPLKREIERWLDTNAADERKRGETPAQFLYKTRKKAIGPYKENVWNLPEGTKKGICDTLQEKFEFLFERLKVVNTKAMVAKYV